MRKLTRGPLALPGSLALPLAIASLSLLAGCSETRAPGAPAVYSWSYMEPPVPAARPLVRRDLEDDGIEVQTAPSLRVRAMPDDPREPWSRNYGRSAGTPAVSSSEVYRDETVSAAADERVASSE